MNNQKEKKQVGIMIKFINGEQEIFYQEVNDELKECVKDVRDDSKLSFYINGGYYFKSAIRKVEIN